MIAKKSTFLHKSYDNPPNNILAIIHTTPGKIMKLFLKMKITFGIIHTTWAETINFQTFLHKNSI